MCWVCEDYEAGKIDGDEAIKSTNKMMNTLGRKHATHVFALVFHKEIDDLLKDIEINLEGIGLSV